MFNSVSLQSRDQKWGGKEKGMNKKGETKQNENATCQQGYIKTLNPN